MADAGTDADRVLVGTSDRKTNGAPRGAVVPVAAHWSGETAGARDNDDGVAKLLGPLRPAAP